MSDNNRYEYECSRCGVVTIHGPVGGRLGCGMTHPDDGELHSGQTQPECEARGSEIAVTAVAPDGSRNSIGTMASLTGGQS